MCKPVFVLDKPGFMGLGGVNEHFAKYSGDCSSDVQSASIYVDGELEGRVGYDIASFASGHILDTPTQRCILVDNDGVEHDAVIVMTDRRKFYAKQCFIVAPEDAENGLLRVRRYVEEHGF